MNTPIEDIIDAARIDELIERKRRASHGFKRQAEAALQREVFRQLTNAALLNDRPLFSRATVTA